MALIGYHASHEQLRPSRLLECVIEAEQAGFEAAMCSDHLAPWGDDQGESGHAWSWLGAALQATSLSFGVVTAPVQRYHPAVSAQAMATISEMFPGRFWAALGSGENVNEHVTGEVWPNKEDRDARLLESVEVIRALLAGEEVTTDGHITVDRARVWSLPDTPPKLIGAAVSESTARTVGQWADGLITVNQPIEKLEKVLAAFGESGSGKPAYLQVHLSWSEDYDRALEMAYSQWKTNVFGSTLAWNLETPEQFDEAAEFVRPEDVEKSVLVSAEVGQHIEWLQGFADLGFDAIYLHHVGKHQSEFIRVFGDKVIGAFA